MKNYELVCILDPQVGEGKFEPTVERYEAYIKENGGEVSQIDNWGLRRLAYTSASLRNRRQGYYVIYQFVAEPSLIDAMEQTIKLDEIVLRYLLTAVEGEFVHVPQPAADNFLEEAFARPSRGPRDRDRGGPPRRDRDDRGSMDDRPPRAAAPAPAAAAGDSVADAVAEESDDS